MSSFRTALFTVVATVSLLLAGVQALAGESPMPEAVSAAVGVAVGEALVGTARQD